jgi:preprotein translocase subunit SecG
MMNSGRIARYRNYSELMRQHDRDSRIKRILRVFTYFLVVLFLLIILLIVLRWESRQTKSEKNTFVEIFDPTRDFVVKT